MNGLRSLSLSMSVVMALCALMLFAGGSIAAENLATFEVRQDGKVLKTWTLAQVQKLPAAEFKNRQGKKRPGVLLSTLLERSGVPMGRVASVAVMGLGGDAKKGPTTKNIPGPKGPGEKTREFKGDDLPKALGQVAVFYNFDKIWTLADLDRATPGHEPWDQARVRKIRHIDVTLK